MADLGYAEAEIRGLPEAIRPAMLRLFRAFLKDLRIGHPNGDPIDPALNFGGAFLHGTTPAIAGTELALPHSFGRTPYLACPILRLDAVGSSVVPLTVSRLADEKRIYVTSTLTSVPVSLYVEG